MTNECNAYEMALSAFVDGELSNEEIRPLFLHLADCENCRRFWRTLTRVERKTLQERAIVPSMDLDERVASIGIENQPESMHGRENDRTPHKDVSKVSSGLASMIPRRSIPRYAAVIFALLSCLLGVILGTLQPWSDNFPDRADAQIVYVSILPNITVLGHVNEMHRQGGIK